MQIRKGLDALSTEYRDWYGNKCIGKSIYNAILEKNGDVERIEESFPGIRGHKKIQGEVEEE